MVNSGGLFRLLLLLAFLLGLASPQSDAKNVKVLKLEQSHYFFGPVDVFISHDAIRLDNKGNMGFQIVSRAPNWDIHVFRLDDKTIFHESLKAFEETGLVSGFLVGRRERSFEGFMRKSVFKMNGIDVVRLTTPYRTIKYLPLKDYGPPQIETVIYSAYKLTTGGQIPLEIVGMSTGRDFITQKDTTGQRETFLSTKKISIVDVPESIFVVPGNLKAAKGLSEVITSATTREDDPAMSDFLNAGSRRPFSHK